MRTLYVGSAANFRYDQWIKLITDRIKGKGQAFTTNAEGLFEHYLDGFPAQHRQYHNCHACRRFIETYGGLVTIGDDGSTHSLLWDHIHAPAGYERAVENMADIVREAKITGVFYSDKPVWGEFQSGGWSHLAAYNPAIFRDPLRTPHQAMADKQEEYKSVIAAIKDYTPSTVKRALSLLQTNSLYRSEKVIGPVRAFAGLLESLQGVRGRERNNLIWRYVASNPPSHCHIRSGMAGTLLDDIKDGLTSGEVERKFAAKMSPTEYMRSRKQLKGNIIQAEKIFDRLGAAESLKRRFARLEDLDPIWRPKVKDNHAHYGVFSHLKTKKEYGYAPDNKNITWHRFKRDVLPHATSIQVNYTRPSHVAVFTTAVNPDAPCLFKYGSHLDNYYWLRAKRAEDFMLEPGWCEVNAVIEDPAGRDCAYFILAGARETQKGGLGLFPETLKPEYHAIRSTIEAFSRNCQLEGFGERGACGVAVNNDNIVHVQVTLSGNLFRFLIDRWD